jgi:hypothetical protein
MTLKRWTFASLPGLVAALALGCGGGSAGDVNLVSPSANSGSSAAVEVAPPTAVKAVPAPTATAVIVPEATVATAPDPTATAQPAPQQGGTLDMTAANTKLASIQSYRFDLTLKMHADNPGSGSSDGAVAAALMMALLGNIEMEGAYVAPDRSSVSMTFFGMNVQTIQIGDQAWSNQGTGWVVDTPSSSSEPIQIDSPSQLPVDLVPKGELAGAMTTTETVNGVETTHFSFDKDSLGNLADLTNGGLGIEGLEQASTYNLDVWLTAEGIPVKMTVVIEGESDSGAVSVEMEYNIKDLNDPTISIEAPI